MISFYYNIDEMLGELNACSYQLAYGEIALLKAAEPINNVEDLQNFHTDTNNSLLQKQFHLLPSPPTMASSTT